MQIHTHLLASLHAPAVRALALALPVALGSCESTPAGPPIAEMAGEINATLTNSALLLSPGDQLSVRFTQFPDWNHVTAVLSDGTASFLSLDDMQVAGLTVDALDTKLTEAYAGVLTRPELTVLVTENAVRNFYVLGEVGVPGAYPIDGGRTSLVQALAMAGGQVRDTSAMSHTLLVRWLPAENRVVTWTINARPKYWSSPESILLQPHDVVYVPATPIVHVNDWIDRYIRRMIPFPYLVSG